VAKETLMAEALRREMYQGSVLMTQAQALTAATLTVRGGELQGKPDADLKRLFLANTIALGFGPRSARKNGRAIWDLLANELDVSPVANYPTVADYSMNLTEYVDRGVLVPGYEFWALTSLNDLDVRMFSRELRTLSMSDWDDLPTRCLQRFCIHFGAENYVHLRDSFKMLLLHAGLTMKTVAEDTENVSADERTQRLELSSSFEGRMLALAKSMMDNSERWGLIGGYGLEKD
jgi:hypothetical protein